MMFTADDRTGKGDDPARACANERDPTTNETKERKERCATERKNEGNKDCERLANDW